MILNNKTMRRVIALPILVGVILLVFATMGLYGITQAAELKPLKPAPAEYANKHMPKGWWTDPKIIKEGEAIYQGRKYGKNVSQKKRVFCSICHGEDGKSKIKGVPHLKAAARANRMSDGYWFWRISEGVPKTLMISWKPRLTEEEIWKVTAYARQFSNGGKAGGT